MLTEFHFRTRVFNMMYPILADLMLDDALNNLKNKSLTTLCPQP